MLPLLLDEIIGYIFSHITPKTLGLFPGHHIDRPTLKKCALVSHQFAYWARHFLHRRLHLGKPNQVAHYISLFNRYPDMPTHIKILEITMLAEYWTEGNPATESGYDDLSSLLDRLVQEGSVDNCHFRFVKAWDQLKPELHVSILRFLLSKPFKNVEFGEICACFPIECIPLPWLARRVNVATFKYEIAELNGELYLSCSDWEKEKRESGSGLGTAPRELKNELMDAANNAVDRLISIGAFHPEKTKLESLWLPASVVRVFESHLREPKSRPAINNLRELQFTGINDGGILDVVRLVEACKDTLESLCLHHMQVQSATSSNLSALTSIPLPRLHTLTIITNLYSGLSVEAIKSMAWYLLHTSKNQKVTGNSVKNLNLIFSDPMFRGGILNVAESVMMTITLTKTVFETFQFFKLEKAISDFLTPGPGAGKVNLWFLLAFPPGPGVDRILNRSAESAFPNLVKEKRATCSLGQSDEYLHLADALSLFPTVPPITRHQMCMMGGVI